MDDAGVTNPAKRLFGQETACWRKSSRSTFNGQCVEVAVMRNSILVRDSKDPGPILEFSPASWATFISYVKEETI
jgi:hypothetical protein